jgi:hypothetical protein
MGVPEILARIEAGGFIGLHDLLADIAESNGVTYQQAARILYRLWGEAQRDGRPFPLWHRNDSVTGVDRAGDSDTHKADWLLRAAIKGGDLSTQWAAEDDIPF